MGESGAKRNSKERWAEFRFGVVGALLSSPPERGGLRQALRDLAARTWQHPITGKAKRYGIATIERWYYRSYRERGSIVQALRRKTRVDVGRPRVLDESVKTILREQYRIHPIKLQNGPFCLLPCQAGLICRPGARTILFKSGRPRRSLLRAGLPRAQKTVPSVI